MPWNPELEDNHPPRQYSECPICTEDIPDAEYVDHLDTCEEAELEAEAGQVHERLIQQAKIVWAKMYNG